MSRLPPTRSSGFGSASVSGRMRSPRPAARTIAFTGLHLGLRRAKRRLPRFAGRDDFRLTREILRAAGLLGEVRRTGRAFRATLTLRLAVTLRFVVTLRFAGPCASRRLAFA